MAQLNFDATQVEPDTGFDTVPAGWYNVSADESDLKPTKDGAGTYLQMRFNVLDGQYRGRKLFARLNIRNANAQAQEIALRQLSAIGHAVGVLHIQDSQQLHGLPLKVKVKVRKGDGEYEDSNEIISYKNINEPVETVGSAPAAAAPAGFAPPPQGFAPPAAPAGFAQPPAQAPAAPAAAPAPQPWAQPPAAAAPAPVAEAPQPWAQPPMAAAPAPQADPSNPFAGAPQGWNGGAAPAPGAPAAAAPAAGPATAAAQDPAVAAQLAAAGQSAPPWAQPQG